MTVKELSEFTGKTERAVRNWIKKASEKSSVLKEKSSVSSPMNPADYSIDEVEQILSCSNLGVNATCIVMANARESQNKQISNVIDYEALTKSMVIAVTTALTPLIEKVIDNKLTKYDMQLPAPKNSRDTLRQLISQYARKHTSGDHQEAWGYLYEEVYYRLKINVRVRAKNEGVSKLDIIEQLGYLDECCKIMQEAE